MTAARPRVAVDVALLPPPDVSERAVALSRALPAAESQGLQLGPSCLPHITLSQQFVDSLDVPAALGAIDAALGGVAPLVLHAAGGGRGERSVWIAIELSAALRDLHARVMTALRRFEHLDGDATAFVDGDARPRDIEWVRGYRRRSSFDAFTPHITLGHASMPPSIVPFTFTATTVAACQLGRFCTCRRVLRSWEVVAP